MRSGHEARLEGSADLVRRTGTATLQISPTQRFRISDSNIDNNGPCP